MIRSLTAIPLLVLVVVAVACGPAPPDLEWPQWRGPGGLGIAESAPLPVTWSAGSDNIRWKIRIPGRGNSSPLVSGGRVFLTTAHPGEKSEEGLWRSVLALDLTDGKVLWLTRVFLGPEEMKHRFNTSAAPTGILDGHSLFVYFGSVLARLDLDGRIIWQKEIDPLYTRFSRYGASSSLVLTSTGLVVFRDQETGGEPGNSGRLASFDPTTGEEQWRTEWQKTCCSYSTPLVVRRGEGEGAAQELIVAHSGETVSYDPATGARYWSYSVPINQMVSSPVIEGDLLGISGGAHNVRFTQFLRLIGTGADTRLKERWSTPRGVPHTSSPLLVERLFLAVTDSGVFSCRDARNGKLLWEERLSHSHNRVSLLAGDGKVYIPSATGKTSVVALSREFNLLAVNDLGEKTDGASPAVAGGCLLLRTRKHLFCIEAET